MTDKVLPDEITDKLAGLIKEIRDTCYHNHDVFRKDAEALDQNDPFQKVLQISDRLDSTLFQLLGNAFAIMGILSTIINRVATSIEKLPGRSEFDVVKDELQTARGLIDNAVIPDMLNRITTIADKLPCSSSLPTRNQHDFKHRDDSTEPDILIRF
ncbi:MAG: hypothetical protein WCC17_06530, partial [Candidatus Nitrosopolaris sp.]